GLIAEMIEARIRERIDAEHRGIVASGHLAVAAIELAAEFGDVEASAEPAADRLIYSGQGGHLVGEAIGRLAIHLALHQVGEEFTARVFFDVGEIGARQLALALSFALSFGLARDRGVARKAVHILQDRGAGIFAEVEHGRDQDQSLDPDALLGLQIAHELGAANGAIAFAGDEFRRQQAVVFLEPAADHHGKRADVAVDGEEFLADVFAGRHEAAVTGADGIDEDEIGEVEPGLDIGLQLGRGRRRRAGSSYRRCRPAARPCRRTGESNPPLPQRTVSGREDRAIAWSWNPAAACAGRPRPASPGSRWRADPPGSGRPSGPMALRPAMAAATARHPGRTHGPQATSRQGWPPNRDGARSAARYSFRFLLLPRSAGSRAQGSPIVRR